MNNTSKLPQKVYCIGPHTGEPCVIWAGERCYYGVPLSEHVEELNKALGVTPDQVAAMIGGVEHGFDSPYSDPDNYFSDGVYKGVEE